MQSCYIHPVLYSKYCTLQEKEVVDFLLMCASVADWGNLTNEVIVDVGCGPGTSCRWILSLFPDIKNVIAVDTSEDVISLAKVLYPHPKVEYIVADISKKVSMECWEGTVSKVISTWCLHCLEDQRKALRNIHNLLTAEGQAAVLFELQSSYYDALIDITDDYKWKTPLEGVVLEDHIPESHFKKFDAGYYRKILEDVGFTVLLCEAEQKTYTFFSDDECKGSVASICSLLKIIPSELKDEFMDDFFRCYLKRNGRAGNEAHRYSLFLLCPGIPSEIVDEFQDECFEYWT